MPSSKASSYGWFISENQQDIHGGVGSHLPSHEANRFNNRRLDYLLTREDTPGNGVWPLTVCVGSQVATLVNCIVCDMGVTFDLC